MLTSTVATIHDNSTHGGDNYLVRGPGSNALLDAVMDGVTGRGGAEASRTLAEALAAAPLTSPEDVVAVLEDVNARLYRIGRGHFLLTTVSAALFLHGTLSVVSVGDSPAFLIRSASYQRLSSKLSGVAHPGIPHVIGARRPLVNLYSAEVRMEPGDRLVLATDGVTHNVTSCELVEITRAAASPADAAERISAIIATRRETGVLPRSLGGGFRHDDWTAIFRFFSQAG